MAAVQFKSVSFTGLEPLDGDQAYIDFDFVAQGLTAYAAANRYMILFSTAKSDGSVTTVNVKDGTQTGAGFRLVTPQIGIAFTAKLAFLPL